MKEKILTVLRYKFPNLNLSGPDDYNVANEDTENLIFDWYNKDITKPTDSEIDTWYTEWEALQYQRDRIYPTWQEQMDMQYHDQLNGTTTWKDAVAKVKSDNPKDNT
jgi:hypothetical protein